MGDDMVGRSRGAGVWGVARALVVVVVIGLVGLFVVKPFLEHPNGNAPGVVLTDLHNVADLQARFNADVGTPRLILLLSPT